MKCTTCNHVCHCKKYDDGMHMTYINNCSYYVTDINDMNTCTKIYVNEHDIRYINGITYYVPKNNGITKFERICKVNYDDFIEDKYGVFKTEIVQDGYETQMVKNTGSLQYGSLNNKNANYSFDSPIITPKYRDVQILTDDVNIVRRIAVWLYKNDKCECKHCCCDYSTNKLNNDVNIDNNLDKSICCVII